MFSRPAVAQVCAFAACAWLTACGMLSGFDDLEFDLPATGSTSTSTSASTSTGAAGAACTEADEATTCDDGEACTIDACDAPSGVCTHAPLDDGAPPGSADVSGDCQRDVCASGEATALVDDDDLPHDRNPCTADICNGGVATHTDLAVGTPCGGVTGLCDGAGKCVECNVPTDCPGLDDECQQRTCVDQTCGVALSPLGAPVAQQDPGDCKVSACDGAGSVTELEDLSDVPDDFNPCTSDNCSGGAPGHSPVASGTSCGGALVCNPTGDCTGCAQAAECPGADDVCKTRTCVGSVCGFVFAANNTQIPADQQAAGDCQQLLCNGNGSIKSVNFNSDLPLDDGKQCTNETCTNGAPAHPPKLANTPCNQDDGKLCSPAGACVACNAASDCESPVVPCESAVCVNNLCDVQNTPAGMPASAAHQDAGDCTLIVCDGSGGMDDQADPTDLPVDGNACTSDLCSGTVPSNSPSPAGTPCADGICDGMGSCGCDTPSECPGVDTECQERTCVLGACGMTYAPMGSAVSVQADGDCQSAVCDGSGAVIQVVDDDDAPDDGKECTADGCSGAVPIHSPKPLNTACGVGAYCDATGTCVGCNDPAHCGVSDDCKQPTCVNSVCGWAYTPNGTLLPAGAQTPGDCKVLSCNGSGSVQVQGNDPDVPNDGNPCTEDFCTSGTPHNDPAAAGTFCGPNSVCDGVGNCKQAPGQPCASGGDCASGFCADGFCCNSGCSTVCYACAASLTAAANGTCAPIDAFSDDASPMCGAMNTCNGAGACKLDSGQLCSFNNQCASGFCTGGLCT